MRRAGQASGRAFTEAMRQSWTREKDLWTFMDYKFKNLGCDTSAYVPVVAGGKVVEIEPFALLRFTTLMAPECSQDSLCPE